MIRHQPAKINKAFPERDHHAKKKSGHVLLELVPDNKQDGPSSLKLRGYSTQLIFKKLRPRESSNPIEFCNLWRILTCNLCFVATSCAVSFVEHIQ